jgi:(1->4)-alpha-D-glucan 1-alpha-D-glucosylmutase
MHGALVVASAAPITTRMSEIDVLVQRLRAQLEGARRPASTYRLQLEPRFGFREAAAVAPYLAELGITDLYLSPPFEAAPGSAHGYDVVDPNRLRDELGGEAGFAALTAALRAHKLGLIVDFVPNHMGIGPSNAWWTDVLENGPSSVHASVFDVDWRPIKLELQNKVLVPVLGDQFGEVLERGELHIGRDGGAFYVAYWEHRFPIAPRQVPRILTHRLDTLVDQLGESDLQLQELLSIITALEKLAPRSEVDAAKVAERAREKEVSKRRLATLFDASPRIRDFVDENLRIFNGTPGDPRSFDLAEALLDGQAYRLAHWRVAGEEINYRRFFDINALAAIRMEDEQVFDETHRLVLRLIAEGAVDGLRIDHPDGLFAPSTYFRRLQVQSLVERCRRLMSEGADETKFAAIKPALEARLRGEMAAGRLPARPLYVVVEKILEGAERMPASWTVDGTTGYEFLNAVNGLYVDPGNAAAFDALYADFIGGALPFDELVYQKKKMLLGSTMASELRLLSHRLNRISEGDRRTRDFTLSALERALEEYIASLPVYRTYIEDGEDAEVDERDRRTIESTIARAKRRTPDLSMSTYDFLRDILLLRAPPHATDEQRAERLELVGKLQQVSGPVTAKAIEDTVFYIYHRLISLNEVGGDPSRFGASVEAFHELNRHRLARWPGSLNATTTHDTKRSEDVRLRIDALSEIPDEWARRVRAWAQLNRHHKTMLDGQAAPDANDELQIYQTLVGFWPADARAVVVDGVLRERLLAYFDKALKEAKVHTSWTNPDEGYAAATRRFVASLLVSGPFLEELLPFVRRIAHAAAISSLSQVALKIASPGVADVYQGTELGELSLVDPDNRRPVDFAQRAARLAEVTRASASSSEGEGEGEADARRQLAAAVATPAAIVDGRAKLLLTVEGLRLRREDPELFLAGDYLPLAATGAHAGRVVALARRRGARRVACVAPRLVLGVAEAEAWRGRVALPDGEWLDVVTGRRLTARGGVDLAELWSGFPVALLRGA